MEEGVNCFKYCSIKTNPIRLLAVAVYEVGLWSFTLNAICRFNVLSRRPFYVISFYVSAARFLNQIPHMSAVGFNMELVLCLPFWTWPMCA